MKKWWKDAVIYQIYPRSFCDSNGDGIGDLQGIISRLDYLEELGVDAIWLSPVYRSPQDDNGYDISDYRDIDPIFGSLSDMDDLIYEAKKRGIRIIMDLVLNHSSDEHPWFLEAKKSRDNLFHDYYVWRDGKEGCPPNDLKSNFGGSAWEWVPECGQYYLHQFSVKQPDLNWDNVALRNRLYDMIRWWARRGVGGFRLDVIDTIGKDIDNVVMVDGPTLHQRIREMSLAAFQGRDLVTVGEAWSATPEGALLYSNPDESELSMVFQFEHVIHGQEKKEKWERKPLSLPELKGVFQKWQKALEGRGWNSLFLENHDLPRSVSCYGDEGRYRVESAKMLATFLHGMQGTPYIYQGQEIGMTNARMEIGDYRDIEILNMYRERTARGDDPKEIMEKIHRRGRDNARTPMQWDDTPCGGFSQGTPWIPVNPNYREINVKQALEDEDSIFYYYKSLIRMRKDMPIFVDGSFELLLPEDPHVAAYTRTLGEECILILCNFKGENVPCGLRTHGRDLLCNYKKPALEGILRPFEACIIRK
ncbi:MAG: alpha-glucosidase [Eubacteriales bacterium]|nr:alpha-glucosidase [Eubacteriales bacterium]